MSHTAALVSIGDELIGGALADTNSSWLAAALAEVGVGVECVHVVGDDEERVALLFERLLREHVLVVASGGLGPTLDDVTRHAAARAVGRELVFLESAWKDVAAPWVRRGEEPPVANRRQALVPLGAELFTNSCGTAPGFCSEVARPGGLSLLVCLPGPPLEFQAMARAHLLPRVAARLVEPSARPYVARGTLFGLGESAFADRCGDWMERTADPVLGVCAREGTLLLTAISRGDGAGERVAQRMGEVATRFAKHWVAADHVTLEATLVRELTEAGRTVAFAESCTGGLVASALTSVPGVSRVLTRSFVTYSDAAKTDMLQVPADLVRRHGAVSSQVAAAMARGARAASGADFAVAISGIAGPDGGSPDKPVGRVEFGLCERSGTWTFRRTYANSGRERVRRFAVQQALALVLWANRARLGELSLTAAPTDDRPLP